MEARQFRGPPFLYSTNHCAPEKAWYNLALASEINDDLEKAAGYIDKAYETALVYKNKNELQRVLRYREIIGTRLKEIEKMRQSVTR